MAQKQKVVGTFNIPKEMAQELSQLLVKQTIRKDLLKEIMLTNPEKYEDVEKELIPVVEKIEAIKLDITKNYVPEIYQSEEFMWNYDGWEVDKNEIQVIQLYEEC